MSNSLAAEKNPNYVLGFAWVPVFCEGLWVWLEFIEYRVLRDLEGKPFFDYRLPRK